MNTESALFHIRVILCASVAALGGSLARAQDLPFASTSSGADGPLRFLCLSPGPTSYRSSAAMAYDSAHQRVVLFGGYSGSSRLNDTWAFDGTQWTKLSPETSPSARTGHAMAYDSARQRVVLFGGYPGGSSVNDTWVFDGTQWTQLSLGTSPSARCMHAMAYDSAHERVVLFGGYCDSYVNDTWVFDGTRWTQLSLGTSPSARGMHAMAYDSARQRVVLFGGYSGSSYLNDTWVFDGTQWTKLSPETSPSARYNHAMAYDSAHQRVVLFGGTSGSSSYFGDTWVFDGTQWTKLSPETSPSARSGHAMAYDSARQRVVLSGGESLNDTWVFNGADWVFLGSPIQYFDMRSRANGIWHFSSIQIAPAVEIKFIKNDANTPVVWLATGDVTINGTLNLKGESGRSAGGTNQWPGNEAQGGPGGFAGGLGGNRFDTSGSYAGTAGQGPGGGIPGVTNAQSGASATHRSRYGNAYLQPLIGGSGGGGSGSGATSNGSNGGGGGGAIYISSSRDIVVNGTIAANGGVPSTPAGGGSGGAIRLQADRIAGSGSLIVDGGSYSSGESGRIRLEAYLRNFTGSASGEAVSSAPVTNHDFALTGNLLITSVAGQNVVQPPRGSTQNPDVAFSAPGPINVTAIGTSIPDGTPVVFRVLCSGQIIQATNTLSGGTATVSVTVPAGVGTIQAQATYTIGD